MSNATKFDQFKFDVLPFDTDILKSVTTRTPNADVGLKYDIAIDGVGYRLAQFNPLNQDDSYMRKKQAQPSFVDIQNQGDRDDNTLDAFWWHEVFTKFQLGEGQKHKISNERYWTATGIDIGEKKEFKLCRAASLVKSIHSSFYTTNIIAKTLGSNIYVTNVARTADSSPSASPSSSPSASASGSPSTSPSSSPSESPSSSDSPSASASTSPSTSPSSSPSTSESSSPSSSESASPSGSESASPSASESSSPSASASTSPSSSPSTSASGSPSTSASTSPSTSPSASPSTSVSSSPSSSPSTSPSAGTSTTRTCAYSSDGSTFTEVSAAITTDVLDVEADGTYVYGAHAAGVARGTLGSATAWTANWCTTAISKLLWHNNALYGINANQLYLIAAGAGSTKKWPTDATTNYTLTAVASASSGSLFFCGYSGDNSLVWEYDGTNITVFATLPRGFIPQSLEVYLGVIYVGGHYLEASSGGRAALYAIASDGAISEIGILDKVDTASGRQHSIRSLHGYKKKLYFGYDHLTGIGIYDIANGGISKYEYIDTADAANNKVTSVGWFLNKPFFTIGIASAVGGLYWEASTYLASGGLTTSISDHGTSNKKLYSAIEAKHSALAAGEQIQVEYTIDDGTTWISAETNQVANTTKTVADFDALEGYRIATRTTLTSGTSQATTPTVYDVKIKAVPVLNNLFMWEVPILINRKQKLIDGSLDYRTVEDIADDLADLKANNQVVLFQDIYWHKTGRLHYAVVEDFVEITPKLEPRNDLEAIIQLKLREVR